MADIADLAIILFLPWFLILGALYWYYPRTLPRTPERRRFDLTLLAIAFAASFVPGAGGIRSPAPASKPVRSGARCWPACWPTRPSSR
jgi:hypothetical protein